MMARASGSGWKPISVGLLAGPHRIAIAATLLVVILAAWVANGRTQGSFDTLTNSLIPVALITKGGLQLEDFDTAATQRWGRLPSAFREGPHGLVSKYPIATGLHATPIMAPDGQMDGRGGLAARYGRGAAGLGAVPQKTSFAIRHY